MRISALAVLVGVLAVVCAAVAWEWYAHVGGGQPAPKPVAQITASTPAASPTPTSAPVVFVPREPAPTSAPRAIVRATPAATARPAVAPASPRPTPAPSVTLTPFTASSGGAVAEEPMVVATLAPHIANISVPREQADAPPRILSMSISTPVAHGGQVVSGTVETTSNVASVEARIAGYAATMQKIGVGRFALSYRVPNLPFFLTHRTYTIEVIARNTRGDAVQSSVPITIR